MLQALTDKNFCLRVAQYRLQNSKCFMLVLSFMQVRQVVRLQMLSQLFYDQYVPKALNKVPINQSSILSGT